MSLLGSHHFRRFALIALLANLAFAQPLYSLLGEQAEFLVAHGLGRWQLIALAGILSLLLPALLAAVPLALAKFSPMPQRESFYLLFIVLGALALAPAGKAFGLAGLPAVGASAFAATAVAAAYWRFDAVRLFFHYLSPAILAFPLVFLLWSRAAGIVMPAAADAGETGAVQEDQREGQDRR